MKKTEEAIIRFRQEGYKITPQRRAIFEILFKNDSHPKAETIYEEIKVKMPDISRTTVYTTLKELNDLGIIDVVRNIGENINRYDPNTEDHHHLYCLQCHRIIDIENYFKGVELSDENSSGFQIIKQQITFFGYCPDCQQNRKTKTVNA